VPKPVAAATAVVVAVVVVVALVVVVVVTSLGAGDGDAGASEAGAPTVSTEPTVSTTATVPPAGTSPGADSADDAAAPLPQQSPDGTAPTAAGPGTGWTGSAEGGAPSEGTPQASAGPTSLADLLPSAPPSAGAYTSAPPDADAVGSLTAGFPSQVIYVPADATIRSSSITTDSGRSQAALDATVPGTCAALLITTRDWYARGGFAEHTLTETPDGAQLEFTRDGASIAITARPADSGCSVVLAGVLTPTGATP
jgi:hypothetical protein